MDVRINGILADSGEATIAVTKQGYDFTDLKKRFVGRTNRFVLSPTDKNKTIFKKPEEIATNADSFEVNYNCDIIEAGDTVLKGFALLEEAERKYKIQVVDRAKILFNLLEQNLRYIYSADSDFEFGPVAFDNFKQPNSSLWLWGSDCQHISKSIYKTVFEYYPATPGSQDVTYSRPHFAVREIIDRIFEAQGWTFEDFDGDDKLNRAIISSNHEDFFVTSYEKDLQTQHGGDYQFSGLDTYDFKQSDVDVSSTQINIKTQKAAFRLRGNISCSGTFEIQFTALSGPNGDDQTIQSFTINKGQNYIDITTDVFETDEIYNNISIKLILIDSGVLTFQNTKLYNIISEKTFDDLSTNPLQGFKVITYDNLPEMSQIDFLREIWTIFGFGINVNQVEKKILPFAYSEFSRENAVDWSRKYIENTIYVRANVAQAKENYLIYDNDKTLPSLQGGSSFLVDNNNLPEESELYRSYFSASKQIQIQGNDIFSAYYFTVGYMPIYNDTSRENDLNPRIFLYRTDTTFPSFGVGTYFNSFSSSPYPAETQVGISFEDLVSNEYALIIKAIQKNRPVQANFMLNKYDVVSFNFSKLMYCEDLKSFFLVIKINNFRPGLETTCEILKLS